MKVLSRIAGLVLLISLIVLLVRGQLLSRSPFVIAGQVLALVLMFWARANFARGQFRVVPEPAAGATLIESGPYRWLRHPMYAGALLLLWSSVLGHPGPVNLAMAVVATVLVMIRIADEERSLREQLPGYETYRSRTKRIVPFLY
ncbi:MAG: isoprenylcysteine carboxylmethyltransferase family protein [Candidatus Eisenbacteria bacterium]|nr:isoprenylcysteine carboxylmethyltransferase family protein [Candidatus Eisenbacteria bacterium]